MSRKKANIHYIYKITNLINGKYYIGKHSTVDLDDDYLGSGKHLRYSIRKYGKENFSKEILEFCDTKESCNEREKEIVNESVICDKMCMNLKRGGDGGFFSLEACKRGAKRMNEIIWKDEEFIKIARSRCSEMNKKYKGRKRGGAGKGWHHTPEAIEKMKRLSVGEKNSQYGKNWINKDKIEKSIKKENLNDYLAMGWKIGRAEEFKIEVSKKMKNNKNGTKKK